MSDNATTQLPTWFHKNKIDRNLHLPWRYETTHCPNDTQIHFVYNNEDELVLQSCLSEVLIQYIIDTIKEDAE